MSDAPVDFLTRVREIEEARIAAKAKPDPDARRQAERSMGLLVLKQLRGGITSESDVLKLISVGINDLAAWGLTHPTITAVKKIKDVGGDSAIADQIAYKAFACAIGVCHTCHSTVRAFLDEGLVRTPDLEKALKSAAVMGRTEIAVMIADRLPRQLSLETDPASAQQFYQTALTKAVEAAETCKNPETAIKAAETAQKLRSMVDTKPSTISAHTLATALRPAPSCFQPFQP